MKKLTSIILLLFVISELYSQNTKTLRAVFYNVENYFDNNADSTREYNEFTSDGNLRWTYGKFLKKRNSLYKTIAAVGEWHDIILVGLAEVENAYVINDLIHNTPLSALNLEYCHFDSNDHRGIDAALLYNTSYFELIYSEPITLSNPSDTSYVTRDIIYAKGLFGEDTLHVLVNHWTSRYRGLLESDPLRMIASMKLGNVVDSIFMNDPNANLIIMGDFNDNRDDESMTHLMENRDLTNLNLVPQFNNVAGTLKYQHSWYQFDQIIVSQSIITGKSGIKSSTGAVIFDPDFLLEYDEKYLGYKPFRTNIGFRYNGGFSDHLPIYLDMFHVQ